MFDHIDLANLKNSPNFGYAKAVPFFKNRKKIQFKPGLNILFGPNGCGKSTILRMLADSLCATQGGQSTVTELSIRDGINMSPRVDGVLTTPTDKIGLAIAHDGQPVIFNDPRNTVGLAFGAFDDDFFHQGLEETMSGKTNSHGQATLRRLNPALSVLMGNAPFPDKINYKLNKNGVNDIWAASIGVLEQRFVASIPLGQPTILLDEPETNHSLLWQSRLWDLLSKKAAVEKFQIIVATHSAFALGIPSAHYIDLENDYRQKSEFFLRSKFSPPAKLGE